MANYSIKELLEFKKGDSSLTNSTFLFANYYKPPIAPDPENPPIDNRPEFIKTYVDVDLNNFTMLDDYIGDKYGNYVFSIPTDNIVNAYVKFTNHNFMLTKTHENEFSFVYHAYVDEFNPRDNYDRREETTVTTDMTVGATTQTAPDDSELFFNVGSGSTDTDGDVTTTSHISGNIGVVDAPTMAKNVISFFGGSGWIEYFIERLIKDNCILVD